MNQSGLRNSYPTCAMCGTVSHNNYGDGARLICTSALLAPVSCVGHSCLDFTYMCTRQGVGRLHNSDYCIWCTSKLQMHRHEA